MTPHSRRPSSGCRVVVGVDAVVAVRSEDPTVPVVALVDAMSPIESVLAQTAGADVVLPSPPSVDHSERPGLELAVRAASTIARRRQEITSASRQTGHDIAEALNVIGLIAQAAQQGSLDDTAAFAQIRDLVRSAGDNAWRVGRAHRSSSFVLSRVDLAQLLESGRLPAGVELCPPRRDLFVFVDESWLLDALGELVGNARRAGASSVRIDASTAADGETVAIVVSDNGGGFPAEHAVIGHPFTTDACSDRLGVGLASIAEHADELGGHLKLLGPGGDGADTQVALSLPLIDPETMKPGVADPDTPPPSPLDLAAAQANILEDVVRHAPLDESLERIVAAIENQLPGTICSVLLLHDGCRLRHSAGARLPLDYREAIDGVVIGVGQGSCGTAAHTGRPVVASDVTTDRNWVDFRSIATQHGLRSCWSTPIVAAEGGETLGTFAVYTPTVWSPDRAAIRLVNRFTYLAAVAIEHHRLFGALAESEARFRSAFEGAAAGIALASLDGVVMKSNPALVELVGRPATVLAGTSLLDLVDPEFRRVVTESWACLTNINDQGTARLNHVEVPLSPKLRGPQKWLSLHTSLIPGESGRQPYLYVEARDVTAARQQLADMRAREAAEAANRAKTDFLALASHELRTPLNAILGFAQIMQLLELDEGQRGDSVDQIVNAGRHLRDLIDELLDLSRIESGQLAVEAAEVDACEVIDEAIELVGPLAAARDIDVVSHIDVGSAPWVLADHRCMRQVLINLLDNAVKYTSSGGRVEVAADHADSSVARISVTDSGPGISPDSLEAIFQPFHRLDRAADNESKGTGLGLALCARLMGEMGGSIGVTSTVGLGSTFWIEFPATPEAGTHEAAASSALLSGASGAARSIEPAEGTVLYIEDDPACLDVMEEALRLRPDVSLRSARTAAEGAAEIARGQVDLVLLDVGLPDRSGWDLLAEMRAAHPALPVIVLTAGPESVPTHVVSPDRVFTKPVDVGEVLVAIDRACSGLTSSDVLPEVVDAGHE